MTFAILHGYLLEGSGSNLWTRCVVEALSRSGHNVHLVCQEPHPDRYDCIAEAHRYNLDGSVETLFTRDVPAAYAGRCVMHKPQLGDTLPVFVWDKYEEFSNPVPMIDLPDNEIEQYIQRNVRVVVDVVRRHGVTAIHANHAALMVEVARRTSEETGVPYAVMPHGSELEYALKKDPRFNRMATKALAGAGRVFVHGAEMRRRVETILPEVPDLASKFSVLPLGVHTWQFEPVPRERRREKIGRLLVSLSDKPRGRKPEQLEAMLARAQQAKSPEELHRAFTSIQYDTKAPDADIEDKLSQLDWEHDAVLSPVVAQRVSEQTGIPFAVMPHGSALEYAVKKDARFHEYATDAFSAAECVFVHADEMKRRVETILPDIEDVQRKFSILPLGVHTWQFAPVPRERRREKIGRLLVSLSDKPRGRKPEQIEARLARAQQAKSPE